MPTDTSEKGLESLIVADMTANGWLAGDPANYNREYAVDLVQLTAFLQATQPEVAEALDLENNSPTRQKFLARLQGEITRRGTIDVLRNGIKDGPHDISLYFVTPTPGNTKAEELYAQNRFSITRQLCYSRDETQLSLDMGAFLNGLPVATFELKNNLTKQTYQHAIDQYKKDRDPHELLFRFGRCLVHFALDDQQVFMCTELKGWASWFLPFNKGYDDGAGNPPNADGIKTDYLWKETLTPASLSNILENYAQVVEEKNEKTGKKKRKQIFPRYHQLDVVRKLLADAEATGAGKCYLIQHSAGSGKSNSIAWAGHQLIPLQKDDKDIFDSIIVVTDRKVLDRQIRDTIKQFAQVGATVGHAESSGDLKKFIEDGKKIIISTVQKFPHILDAIGSEHRTRNFAIMIDEAHSSQGGRVAAAMSMALSEAGEEEEEETVEDQINRIMESRKLLPNASYFAFTATPKNKTLELFGEAYVVGEETKHRPFHGYSMKQAIQEGFIMDVLKNYTTVASYYKLIKKVEDDPLFDNKRAKKKLRRFVEEHEYAIQTKAEIMVDHFHEQVISHGKVGGEARAMVVTGGIKRALQYYHAINKALKERKSPYQAIVAFSGEHAYDGEKVTEASLNGFPSTKIEEKIQEDPYRFLVCADKFQTGYDEPLLHTMYVDKTLDGIKAVQTLSRLNRAYPKKNEVFVLDFQNDPDKIQASFEPYYRTTILSKETDPNKLHDLVSVMDGYQVYSKEQVNQLVALYLKDADRDQLDPILDVCVNNYIRDLDVDGKINFKGKAKAFLRTYNFLASILPYNNAEWEKLSIFLNFLVSKLPPVEDEDLSKGILKAIDMDSYRVEKQATMKILLTDEDGEIDPVSAAGGGSKAEPEIDSLSAIVKSFNERFGDIEWSDEDRIKKLITEEIPLKVRADSAFQNAEKNSDRQNARIEHDKALERVITELLTSDTELFKQFNDNPSFKKWLSESNFESTYGKQAA